MGLGQVELIDPVDLFPHPQDLLGMNCNITRLTKIPATRLMNHDTRVGQAEALLCSSPTKQEGAHGGGLADADGGDGTRDVGHGVVNGETGGDRTAGGVDVEVYGLFGGIGFEKEELSYNGGGYAFVDGAIKTDDTFLQ